MAFYELFSFIKLNKQSLLMDLIKALRENVRKYPQDRMKIYACGAKLGSSYADFIKKNALIILQHEPQFIIQEKDRDDPVHILHVVMVAHAGNATTLPFYFPK